MRRIVVSVFMVVFLALGFFTYTNAGGISDIYGIPIEQLQGMTPLQRAMAFQEARAQAEEERAIREREEARIRNRGWYWGFLPFSLAVAGAIFIYIKGLSFILSARDGAYFSLFLFVAVIVVGGIFYLFFHSLHGAYGIGLALGSVLGIFPLEIVVLHKYGRCCSCNRLLGYRAIERRWDMEMAYNHCPYCGESI